MGNLSPKLQNTHNHPANAASSAIITYCLLQLPIPLPPTRLCNSNRGVITTKQTNRTPTTIGNPRRRLVTSPHSLTSHKINSANTPVAPRVVENVSAAILFRVRFSRWERCLAPAPHKTGNSRCSTVKKMRQNVTMNSDDESS